MKANESSSPSQVWVDPENEGQIVFMGFWGNCEKSLSIIVPRFTNCSDLS